MTNDPRKTCVRQMFQAKHTQMSARAIPHECCRDRMDREHFCNPENEQMLIQRRLLDPSKATGLMHIYLCDKWGVHECSDTACNLWHDTGTCPLTGLIHGQMMVDDLRYREVRGVKQLTKRGQAKRERREMSNSSTMRVTRTHHQVHTVTTVSMEETTVELPLPDDTNVQTLGLALLEQLTDVSDEDTDLRTKLTAILTSTEMMFDQKVRSMVQFLRMHPDQTRLADRRRIDAWISNNLLQYKNFVHALKEDAERKEAERMKREMPTVKRRRKMVSSGNMFGSSAVVVEEHTDPVADKLAAEQEAARRVLERQERERTSRRREDGSLIIANKRDEDDQENDDEDAELVAAFQAAKAAREGADRKTRHDAQTPEAISRFKARTKRFIAHLLYGEPRKKIIKRHDKEMARAYSSALKRYQAMCGQKPSWIECMEISYNTHKEPPLSIIPHDNDMLEKYVELVTHVWKVVVRHGPIMHANAGERVCVLVTLATLYSIRGKGLVIRNHTFLPRNSQMLNLPRLNDLRLFHQSEHQELHSYGRSYTLGCDLVKESFETALDSGQSIDLLQIDLEHLKANTIRTGDKVSADTVEMFAVGRGRPRHRKT